ncbi:MAG: aldehyde ferredoxin oxidoreductase [Rhodospirillaceae bacterium]|nr:aldehyde ferredoxin oxidoreductase [Rhodospirillaceae bacterium]
MRSYLDINLATRNVTSRELQGREFAQAGRYFIARTLLDMGVAKVDPMSPENPLIFSAGPFAGTNFSNANRLSIGCRSPLTGGIKEANAGGTFALAMGHLQIAGFTLHGAADDWVVIHINKDRELSWDTAEPYMGRGNIEAAALLHEQYGQKTSIALCSPVGEYLGLLSGIAVSDAENRPVRIAARGGVGAVMGVKKVKAIVIDKSKMPPLHDRPKVMAGIKEYGAKLRQEPAVQAMSQFGTAMVADYTNTVGGLPVRNFSAGQIVDPKEETFEAGGDFIYHQNTERGGVTSHACMPGCLIKCSNIYADEEGNDIVSPLEYETIGLLGTNCGLKDPDDIARLNYIANDLGIDTIETGAMLATLMDHGEAEWGDVAFMEQALEDIRAGSERGRILAQGTARVGEHFGIERVPVIKKQAISAYDPRIIEVTGVSMMLTAQGADHTTGNIPTYNSDGKTVKDLAEASYQVQINSAVADSFGLCVFGRTVTDVNRKLIIDAINASYNLDLPPEYIDEVGRETLRLEKEFNRDAGFTIADDELPEFFVREPLEPTNKKARLRAAEVNQAMEEVVASW